jgi:hypothetical protein
VTLYEIFKRLSNTLWSTVSKAADMSNRTIMCCLLFFLTIICLFIFESGILGRVISLAKLVFDNNDSRVIDPHGPTNVNKIWTHDQVRNHQSLVIFCALNIITLIRCEENHLTTCFYL